MSWLSYWFPRFGETARRQLVTEIIALMREGVLATSPEARSFPLGEIGRGRETGRVNRPTWEGGFDGIHQETLITARAKKSQSPPYGRADEMQHNTPVEAQSAEGAARKPAKILITGASGFTGGPATEILTKRGIPVRALVHKEDQRSERLAALGAEIAVGDLLDIDAVRRALDGIGAAYFVYPIHPGLIDATAYFAQAAKEACVGAIVNMSQISARREAKSHAARDHWIAERVFDWSGLPVTNLRPTFFAEWLLYPWNLASIVERGVIALPLGDGRHAPIAALDQARMVAAILTDPAPHKGKIYPLYGPVEMSQAGIADAVSEVLGRKIVYQPIGLDEFRGRLEKAGLGEFFVQHLCAVALDYQHGVFAGTDGVIEKVTGRSPMTVQEFVRSHRSAFGP